MQGEKHRLGKGAVFIVPPPTISFLLQPWKRGSQGREAAQPKRRLRGGLGKGESAMRIDAERLTCKGEKAACDRVGIAGGLRRDGD